MRALCGMSGARPANDAERGVADTVVRGSSVKAPATEEEKQERLRARAAKATGARRGEAASARRVLPGVAENVMDDDDAALLDVPPEGAPAAADAAAAVAVADPAAAAGVRKVQV